MLTVKGLRPMRGMQIDERLLLNNCF